MGSGVPTAKNKHNYAVKSRLELMTKSYDLREKRVLDVGCGNGVYTIEMAKIARFVFGIDPNDLETLGVKAKGKGVSSKFIVTGFIRHDEVPTYITAGDVGIAPYNPKGFKKMEEYGFYFSPIKIVEYMACGKPIVASDLGIIRDIINENQSGLLAKSGDTEDFVKRIRILLGDDALRKKLGTNGRKAVIGNYSWDKTADRIFFTNVHKD